MANVSINDVFQIFSALCPCYEALKVKAAKFDAAEEAGKTELQKAQGCRDFRAGSAPFLFSEK